MMFEAEQEDMILLENEVTLGASTDGSSFTIQYTNSKKGTKKLETEKNDQNLSIALIASEKLDEYDVLATFMGNEGGVALYYNKKGKEVYLCKLGTDGNPVLEKGTTKVKLFDVFSDNIVLEEGNNYTIRKDYGTFCLTDITDGAYKDISNSASGNYFSMAEAFKKDGQTDSDFLNSLKAVDTKQTNTFITTADEEATAETRILEQTEITAADTIAETAVNQILEQQEFTTVNAAVETLSPEQMPSDETTDKGNGGLIAALLIAGLVAAAAIIGCVMLVQMIRKERIRWKKKIEEEQQSQKRQISEVQQQNKSLLEERDNYKKRLDAANAEIAGLSKGKSEQTLATQRAEDAKSNASRRIAELETENESLKRQNAKLNAEKQTLAVQLQNLKTAKSPTPTLAPVSETLKASSGNYALDLCTSQEALSAHAAETVFVSVDVSIAGNVHLNEAPYRRAHLAVLGNKAYLNPYYFQNLGMGRESFNNLQMVRSVFDIDGLSNASESYGLTAVEPAQVVKGASGYELQQKGKLSLSC